MARAGIITFLHNNNYGSSLQAYALQRALRELGCECLHLDYEPDRKEKIWNLLTSGNDLKLILDGIRKRSVRADQSGARRKSEAIPAFYRKRMQLSAPCRNRKDLRRESENCDMLVCGSDQIWNPVWLNPAYFRGMRRIRLPMRPAWESAGFRKLPRSGKSNDGQRTSGRFPSGNRKAPSCWSR